MKDLSALGGVSVVTPPAVDLKKPQGFRLMSDWHLGARNCDVKRIEWELADAAKRRDRVWLNGDIFDAIVAGDERYQGSTLHPRLLGSDVPLDVAADWMAELLQPVARAGLLDYWGIGNHEAKVQKRCGLGLLTAVRYRLKGKTPAPSGYCGFLNYRLNVAGKKVGRYTCFAHHGAKGGAGGMLKKLAAIADTDLVWCGHFHSPRQGGRMTVSPSECGRHVVVRERRQVMTGAYTFAFGKNHDGENTDNYAAVAAYEAGLLGGARLVLSWDQGLRVEVRS